MILRILPITLVLLVSTSSFAQERTRAYDLRFPAISWGLSPTPQFHYQDGTKITFPEANMYGLVGGYNRAKLAWYIIDPLFQNTSNSARPDYLNNSDTLSNHYTRLVLQGEVYPETISESSGFVNNISQTLDLTFYPRQRGAYNFEKSGAGEPGISSGVNPNSTLKHPDKRWGGIVRPLDVTANVAEKDFIEFWIMDPFIDVLKTSGGTLSIDLGKITEDVLKDDFISMENALPLPGDTSIPVVYNVWGKMVGVLSNTGAFDNDQDNRPIQDVGFDGLNDAQEAVHFSAFIDSMATILDTASLNKLISDPASDNFYYYLDERYDKTEAGILERYAHFNGMQGNSAVQGHIISTARTNLPDTEDWNRDFSFNKEDAYFHYSLPINPDTSLAGSWLVEVRPGVAHLIRGGTDTVNWYHYRIPLTEFTDKYGEIESFDEVTSMRIFLSGFNRQVTLRFARLELVEVLPPLPLEDLIEQIKPIPNPSVGELRFEMDNLVGRLDPDVDITVEVFDVLGRLVDFHTGPVQSVFELTLKPLDSGQYIYRMRHGDELLSKKPFLLHN